MTQKDKELLLKDLSSRLPCKTFAQWYHKALDKYRDVKIMEISTYGENIDDYRINVLCQPEPGDDYEASIVDIKPYLRSLSSMTEEEKLHIKLKFHFSYRDGLLDNVYIFETSGMYDRDGNYDPPTTYREIMEVNMDLILEFINWLNKNMFDYRKDDEGKTMIEKGLALEAPERMYSLNK